MRHAPCPMQHAALSGSGSKGSSNMLKRFIKILTGLLFLPLCLGFTWHFGAMVFSIAYKPQLPYYFLAGGLTYLTAHVLFRKPILAYVFGHELTHALFAMIFGGSVTSFHASDRGGRVTITKSNFLITLAPYFFPFYTFIALILYALAIVTEARGAAGSIIFISGATFSFHIVLTLVFLQTDQTDIREQGAFFSFPLIYLFNIVFAAFLIQLLLAENPGFLAFMAGGIIKSVRMVYFFLSEVYAIINRY